MIGLSDQPGCEARCSCVLGHCGDHPWLFLSVFIVNDLMFGVEEKILELI